LSARQSEAGVTTAGFESLGVVAEIMEYAAQCFFCLIQACLSAQTSLELDLHPTLNDYTGQAPTSSDQEPPKHMVKNGPGRYVWMPPEKQKK